MQFRCMAVFWLEIGVLDKRDVFLCKCTNKALAKLVDMYYNNSVGTNLWYQKFMAGGSL